MAFGPTIMVPYLDHVNLNSSCIIYVVLYIELIDRKKFIRLSIEQYGPTQGRGSSEERSETYLHQISTFHDF